MESFEFNLWLWNSSNIVTGKLRLCFENVYPCITYIVVLCLIRTLSTCTCSALHILPIKVPKFRCNALAFSHSLYFFLFVCLLVCLFLYENFKASCIWVDRIAKELVWVSPQTPKKNTQKHKLRFLQEHKYRAIGYQKEVKKCDIILHLKFDTDVQDTKLRKWILRNTPLLFEMYSLCLLAARNKSTRLLQHFLFWMCSSMTYSSW